MKKMRTLQVLVAIFVTLTFTSVNGQNQQVETVVTSQHVTLTYVDASKPKIPDTLIQEFVKDGFCKQKIEKKEDENTLWYTEYHHYRVWKKTNNGIVFMEFDDNKATTPTKLSYVLLIGIVIFVCLLLWEL